LKGGAAKHNADIARRVLGGATGPTRDIVLLNAGASLFIAGVATSVADGIASAARAIDSGAANERLARMVAVSHAQSQSQASEPAARSEA
jgi:anthranilate phosphoribosyltransferase